MIDVPREDIVVMLEAGYIYLAMKKFKEAKLIFEGICELAPKHDVPQVAVANVYFAQGKYLESIRLIRAAIKERPQSAFAHAHLGEAQLFYGKREEAIESLKKAVELDKNGDGNSGQFAKSLIELINLGYDPTAYRKAFKNFYEEHKAKKEAEEKKGQKGK